jgi:hypothetical protein
MTVMQSSTSNKQGQMEIFPVTSPAAYPDGLTGREVEVLRLVAQG